MASMGNIELNVSNHFVELQALMSERDGMSAENQYRGQCGASPAYVSDDFSRIAEKMRAMKKIEGVREQPTTAQACKPETTPASTH